MFIDDLENGQGQWLLHLRAILFNKAQECWLKSRYKVFSSRWHSFSDKTKKNKSTYLNLFFLFMYNKPFKKIVVNGKSDLICYWKTLHTYKHFWKKLMKNLAWFSYKVIVIFFFVMTSTHVFNYSCRYIYVIVILSMVIKGYCIILYLARFTCIYIKINVPIFVNWYSALSWCAREKGSNKNTWQRKLEEMEEIKIAFNVTKWKRYEKEEHGKTMHHQYHHHHYACCLLHIWGWKSIVRNEFALAHWW